MTVKDPMSQPRVAFISLIDLYQSFRRIPPHILFSCIFILKIRREWLYRDASAVASHPNDDDTQNVLHTLHYDEDEEFMALLKWKDSQRLLLFMCRSNPNYHAFISNAHQGMQSDHNIDHSNALPLDFGIESDDDDDDDMVLNDSNHLLRLQRNESHYNVPVSVADSDHEDDPFEEHEPHAMWMQLSHQLSGLYDPYQGRNYKALILNSNWWLNRFEESQYGASCNDVLDEMYQCHMNYRCVMEILFQSNPSLIPCKNYRELEGVSTYTAARRKPRPKKVKLSEINADSVLDSTNYLEDVSGAPHGVMNWISHDYELDVMLQI